jgi:hypothetical protein
MKRALTKIKLPHIIITILFFASIWFSSAREAQSLCFRLLLHLKGDTFVQGQPPGCVIYTIPNVQFTDKYKQKLRTHSKDSLNAFALAMAGGNWLTLEPPSPEPSWINHPLLQWAALRLTSIAIDSQQTNSGYLKIAHDTVRLAQTTNPTNGALLLADACLDFKDQNDATAMVALETAATKRYWDATSAESFNYLSLLLETAGLSKLDAAIWANNLNADDSARFVQARCLGNIQRLMMQSVNSGNDTQLLQLLNVLVGLRRAEWTDNAGIINNFRRITDARPFDDDLLNAIAMRLGQNPLPDMTTNANANYKLYQEARLKIFQDYFDHLSDQKLAAVFIEQGEAFKQERKLRNKMSEIVFKNEMWSGVFATVAGSLAPMMLSFLILAIGIDLITLKLKIQIPATGKELLHSRKCWLAVSVFIILGSLILTNLAASLGLDSEVGLRMEGPSPEINPILKEFIGSLVICAFCFSYVVAFLVDYRKKPEETERLQWQPTLIAAILYLISIFAMAYFRLDIVEKMAAQFI